MTERPLSDNDLLKFFPPECLVYAVVGRWLKIFSTGALVWEQIVTNTSGFINSALRPMLLWARCAR